MKYSVLATLIIFMCYSCSSDDTTTTDTDAQLILEIENHAINGLWQISNYNDSGDDETSDYNGYTFNFKANGDLTATNGANVLTGTWSVTSSNSDSSDDDGTSSIDDIDFNIFFNVSETHVFDDLIDDWEVSTSSSSQLSLFDVSGGDGSTDLLVFSSI